MLKFYSQRFQFIFLFFLFFYAVKTLTVQNGQIFWEIQKPGIKPSYILGLYHYFFLDENSLPPEITAAISNSQTGLIELSREEQKRLVEAIKTTGLFLPEGETLSLYLGEQKAREVFEFLQSILTQYNEAKALMNKLKTLYGIDITSYETINRLIPFWILQLENLKKLPEKLNEHLSGQEQPDCLSKEAKQMDLSIERALFCKGKPVYSIETAEIQARAFYLKRNHYTEAQVLHATLNKAVQKSQGNQSEMDATIEEWNQLITRITQNLLKHIANLIHQNVPININSEREQILTFLIHKQCINLPTNPVDEYLEQLLQLLQSRFHHLISGTQTEEEFKKDITLFVERAHTAHTAILSSCFLDYMPKTSKEQAIDRTVNKIWYSVQYEREQIFNARNKPQALFLLPYLEEGGVFAAIGANHLKEVLTELEALGWQIKAVPLSHPIKEASREDSSHEDSNVMSKTTDN